MPYIRIDEILTKELDHNSKSKIANNDIESFINFLSSLNSSLKPWVSRLSQAHITSTRSPKDRNCSLDMTISPSPLVTSHAGGRGLVTGKPQILLTPLLKPRERVLSLCPVSSKLGVRNVSMKETNDEALKLSPLVLVSRNRVNSPETLKKNNMSETRMKMSVSIHPHFSEVYSRKGGASDTASSLSLHHNSTIIRDSGEALEWFLSPPKTCALMDPDHGSKIAEDKYSCSSIPTISISASMDSLSPQELHNFAGKRYYDEPLEWFLSPPKTCALMEPLEGKTQSTPVSSEAVLKSRRPGENTLKKELWTKFQAVSMGTLSSVGTLSYTDSVQKETPKKDFLDMLEEVSF